MGLKNTEIKLDNPWNTYFAGQTINGQVLFTFDSPKKIRGIIIRFRGEAHTEWTTEKTVQDREGKSHTETEVLTGNEQYFETQYYLLGGKNAPEISLPAGNCSYPFTCVLPPNLPSSFEGSYGYVRYTIKVTLDRPWKFDQDTKMAFTVVAPLDLNLNPAVKERYHTELEKNFCCLCCRSGPLSVVVKLPVTGFVPGQSIPLTVECDNLSNVEITGITFKLRKTIKFYTNTPRRETRNDKADICEVSVECVPPHESRTWQKNLDLPALPPTNLTNCGLIDINYDIKIDVDVGGPHTNLDGEIPITIGTIPITSFQSPTTYSDTPAAVVAAQQDRSMTVAQSVAAASPSNPLGGALGWNINHHNVPEDLPPPSFMECTKFTNIADANDSQFTKIDPFAPRYPGVLPSPAQQNN